MYRSIIEQAIHNKQVIEFYYDDKQRIVEPYAIGKTSKNKLNLLAIQIGGYSSSHKLPDWRMFVIEKINDIKIHERKFAAYFQVYQSEERLPFHFLYDVVSTAFDIDQQLIASMQNSFDNVIKHLKGKQYWLATDLSKLFGYSRWRSFAKLLHRVNCPLLMQHTDEQITSQNATTTQAKLSLLAPEYCLALAKAAKANRPQIIFALIYFAVEIKKNLNTQTEQVEGLERIKAKMQLAEAERYLSSIIYKHIDNGKNIGRIRSLGDSKLFGGINTAKLKDKLGLKKNQPLSERLPDILLKAKEFAAALTSYNIVVHNMSDQYKIGSNHSKNNNLIRQVLLQNNIIPEDIISIEHKK